MAITFEVSDVPRPTRRLERPPADRVPRLHQWRIEAMGASVPDPLPVHGHGLLTAVHCAYARHYPLVLGPDDVWLAIAQGFAHHVNVHAERLRGKLVRFDGKQEIAVRRDDFVKGSPENPWPEVFAAFSDGVAAHIGKQRDLVVCDLSTTGPCERAASEIVLLDAMQRYFTYALYTLCGIPRVTLEGTAEDWRRIRRRARALEEYELSWWTRSLGPVLDQLVATAEGKVDQRFWQTIFKHTDGSGGPWVGGWINVLFPYLRGGDDGELGRNEHMASWQADLLQDQWAGANASEIPSGLSSAPFTWHCLGVSHPMHFMAGFVGIAQDDATLAVRPVIGWAVRDAVGSASGESAEESAADWLVHRSFSGYGCSLVTGWVHEATLTPLEMRALSERIGQLRWKGQAPMECRILTSIRDSAELPRTRLSIRFLVGAGVLSGGGSTLHLSFEQLRKMATAAREQAVGLQSELSALLPGALAGEPALYTSGGRILFRSKRGDQSFEVANARQGLARVDLSPEAHEARVARARALHFDESSIPYALLGE